MRRVALNGLAHHAHDPEGHPEPEPGARHQPEQPLEHDLALPPLAELARRLARTPAQGSGLDHRAHETQVDPNSGFWFSLPPEVARTIHPYDDYILAESLVDTEVPEDDLFAGVRDLVRR